MMFEWFNGTHLVRIWVDDDKSLGVRIETATAEDRSGVRQTSEYRPFVTNQLTYYKDYAEVLAEGMRHFILRIDKEVG